MKTKEIAPFNISKTLLASFLAALVIVSTVSLHFFRNNFKWCV